MKGPRKAPESSRSGVSAPSSTWWPGKIPFGIGFKEDVRSVISTMVSSDNYINFHDSYVEVAKLAMFSLLLVNDLARYKRAA